MSRAATVTVSSAPGTWRVIAALVRKELRDALRNRWFMLFTLAFGVLALGLSWISLAGTGSYGFAGFGRTAAALVNLVLLIVPLMGLTAGAGALAPEREQGTLSYLLAQPVTRLEVIAGKYIGLGLALAASLCLAFGVSAAVIVARSGTTRAGDFLELVGLSIVLALAMLSVGMLISALTRRAAVATGAAIVVWLLLVFLGDLGLMGSTVAFRLQVTELFSLALINPLQVFKMAALDRIAASLDVLGPAGLYAVNTWGDRLGLLFGAVLAAWVIAPLAMAAAALQWREVA